MATTFEILYPAASVALSVSGALQSLAAGSTSIWSSAVQINTSNLYVDGIVTWVIKGGTSPTAGNFGYPLVWEIMDDTPTYPDVITGVEGAFTATSVNVLYSGAFKFFSSITFDSTTGRVYYSTARLSQAWGNAMPKRWGAGFVNNSGVALSGSGNVVSFTPILYQNI